VDSRIFATNIHDEEQLRQALHVPDTGQAAFQTNDLALDKQALFFGQMGDLTGIAHFFKSFEFLDALVDRGPVGQRAPSQRSVTKGMPQRLASSTIVSCAWRLVPTKRIVPPPLPYRG